MEKGDFECSLDAAAAAHLLLSFQFLKRGCLSLRKQKFPTLSEKYTQKSPGLSAERGSPIRTSVRSTLKT